MKKVILKRLSLVNFKGLRDYSVDFSESVTSVMGRNGTGKTTLFDAFTWLLFGKDSEDRKLFNLKTLDEQGKVIERLPHEVAAIISVDGQDITLCRRFIEKWTKKRGSATEEFTGNEEERLYNDVPCSLKDWNEKIAAICPEQVFKFITNPLYFTSQKSDVQRQMLFRMAGGVSDADVAGDNEDFKNLLGQLTGKTLEEYKREIAAKKRRVKAELDGIPERIDERKRSVPESEDWTALEVSLKAARKKMETIDSQMMDESKQMQEFNARKRQAMDELSKVRKDSGGVRSMIERQILDGYYKSQKQRADMESELRILDGDEKRQMFCIECDQKSVDEYTSKVVALREEWKRINAETLTFNDGDFVCPTCKRPLDIDDIEAKQSEMTHNFNAQKASRLAELSKQGKSFNSQIAEAQKRIEMAQSNIDKIRTKAENIRKALEGLSESEKPDTTPALMKNEAYQRLLNRERELDAIIAETYDSQERSKLAESRKEVQDVVENLSVRLSKREAIESNEKRIAELESQMKKMSVELAALEGIEFTMQEFCKARIEAIESRINALFTMVRFKMFEKQINGGEVETCEAMVGGVPFSDLNNAGKINAGLDIINAICKSESINAPIFVDNAEAVNRLLDTQSQMIRLVVTEDAELVVR